MMKTGVLRSCLTVSNADFEREQAGVTCGGIVLCGGRSSRMGQAKAWLPFGPELMLQRVVRLLGQAVQPIVVVAAEGQDLPPLPPKTEVVRDAVSDRGPLEGLRT